MINVTSFVHDGMIFYFTRESCQTDTVAFYFDRNGIVQPVKQQSVYGEMVLKRIIGAQKLDDN